MSDAVDRLLKWPGGKARLVTIRPDAFRTSGLPHVPFLGGGSVFFKLFAGRAARLSDANARLVNLYLQVQKAPDDVFAALRDLVHGYEVRREHVPWRKGVAEPGLRSFFEEQRASLDDGPPALRAARLLFVVKWGFNGLYRENQKGFCNTPHGDGAVKQPSRKLLQLCAKALAGARIGRADFAEDAACARRGDFVYFDPPYAPLTETASFTGYTSGGAWGVHGSDRLRLVKQLDDLDQRGVLWTLSDSLQPATLRLYAPWLCEAVEMKRSINRDGKGRGAIPELVVRNWGQPAEVLAS